MIDALKKIPGMKSRIGRRMILYILLFSSMITFMGTGLQLYMDYNHDVQKIHSSFEQIKSSHLESITNSLWVTDNELLQIQIEGILRLPDMQLIEVRKGSQVFQAAGTPQSESVIEQSIPLIFVYNGRNIHLGELHVQASLKGIYSRLFDRVMLILGVQSIKTFLVSLFIFIIFYQLVGRYIIYMASFVGSINFQSLDQILHLDGKPVRKDPDELDKLAIAFNLMRENLKKDIIQREAAEKQLRESEDKFRSISESSLVGIYLIQDKVFKYVNPKFCEIFGYTAEECMDNMPFIDLVHPDEVKFVQKQVNKRLSGEEESLQYETRGIKKSGEIIDIVILGASTTYKGAPAAIGTTLDITQRKQTEKKLLVQQYLLQNAQKIGLIGTWELDLSKDELLWTDETYKIFGLPAETKLDHETFFNCVHPDDRAYVEKKWKSSLEGMPYDIKHRILVDGQIKWVREKASFEFTGNGECIRVIGVAQDITQQVELESHLMQAQKMEAIGTLAGGITHDFNNILGIILGYSDILKSKLSSDPSLLKKVDQIIKAGNRAKDLVGQILAFSRKNKKGLIPIQPDPIIKEALKMLRSSIPTTIEIRHTVPKCGSIIGNPTQLHQIMMNLCTNAYHAMRKTGGVLEVILEPVILDESDTKILSRTLFPGPYLKLEISDTGHGIEKTIQQKIFDPYFTTKKKGEGTGLGLAVVHGIVKSLGGHISVYSEPDKGTTFRIYFPQISIEAESQPEKSTEPIPTGDEHILIVDDEKSIVKMENQILRSLGYQISAYTSSPEALKAFQKRPESFALVITDMTMPGMNGIQLMNNLRMIRQDIPIILCSGFSELINEKKAERMGIGKYLMKPVQKRELAAAVREILDTRK